MKSYFLERVEMADAHAALDRILPGSRHPWVLLSSSGDAIAYFDTDGERLSVQADISGRHYDQDEKVLAILRAVRVRAGGSITDDNDSKLA